MGTRIVVGIDGSPAADAALVHALDEAKLRGLPLRIVSVAEVPAIDYAGATFVATTDPIVEADRHAESVLAAAAEKIGTGSGVEVEYVGVHGHPATVLLEQASDATLLVVGTRGRNTLKSLFLGSVSQAIAHHCPVPITIIPTPHAAAD